MRTGNQIEQAAFWDDVFVCAGTQIREDFMMDKITKDADDEKDDSKIKPYIHSRQGRAIQSADPKSGEGIKPGNEQCGEQPDRPGVFM